MERHLFSLSLGLLTRLPCVLSASSAPSVGTRWAFGGGGEELVFLGAKDLNSSWRF